MLDRRTPPTFRKVEHIELPESKSIRLKGGMPMHITKAGSQPVIRLEFISRHGSTHQELPGQAYFTARMLTEGTQGFSGSQIAEMVDKVGAHLEASASLDFTTLTLYTLEKHLPGLLPVVKSLLTEATFPAEEFTTIKSIKRQRLKIDATKNAVVATRTFRKKLYESHAYGKYLVPEDLDNLQPEHLSDLYKKNITGRTELFIAGSLGDRSLETIKQYFDDFSYQPDDYIIEEVKPQYTAGNVFISKEESLQSSLRIGKPLFTIRHPDYHKFSVMNTLFGGYFGSRLMKVIREERGYTYGIYSSINSLKNAGYFLIGADVVGEHTHAAIDEIFNQLRTLQQNSPSITELETVQNYLIGTFLGGFNTPFAIADKYKNLYFNQLPLDFYTEHVKQVYATTPEDIRDFAAKYLAVDTMVKVAVGSV